MDSSKKADSNQRQREEALARRMGEALDRLVTQDTRACPDAEVMAAYHEQSLDPDKMSQCEEHFAGCARCRKILAVLAASDDAPLAETEVANLGKRIAAAQLPRDAASHRTASPIPIKPHWKPRWLAPALGIAAVLAVWFAVKPPWRSQQETATTTLIAQAPQNEPPQNAPSSSVPEFSKAEPRKKSDLDSKSLRDRTSTPKEVSNADADRLSKSRSAKDNSAPAAPAAGLDAIQNNVQLKSEAGASRAVRPAPASPGPSLQAEARQDAAPLQAPRAAAQSGAVNGNEPAKESADAAESNASKTRKQEITPFEPPLNGRAYSALAPLAKSVPSNILVKPPQGLILWRVGREGSIEHSADGGRTWTAQQSPSRHDWVAGSAASNKVCWIVGRSDAIARTTDGEHWEMIPSPAAGDSSGKLPDWTGVTASDAQAAVITTADQRRFSTRDGGKSWQAQ